ncbi:tRNA lysidine(34) synthetase TilS [Alcanivorax sp. S6407]|uniref:tRNA lysidine(34) synthetase TilS n=1 Tax=Alcanivorax sp. S6407 TaxID=2926424 RepID=UPI001FF44025|nr:tRNA lysidine(34) synthetase TilS [Alcanivorax sp. S6407]MCK0152658.1 tRNA lysidine(34) synthetase TilS [Alcanivorax sp. S6407]
MLDSAGFCRQLAEQAPDGPLLLALSGGLDSSLLLHLLIRAGLGPRLSVVHVDHQLQADSPQWSRFCLSLCQHHHVPCSVEQVEIDRGEGIEAGARDARYGVLLPMATAQGATLITAHHRSDQAETLMLRLLRGAGVQGLSAMRPMARRDGVSIWRPLLALERQLLVRWAEEAGIEWLDDPSNEDEGLRRNFLRQRIMPLLRQQWPGAETTLARAADHMSEAAGLLEEIAAEDARELGVSGRTLPLGQMHKLSEPRQRNLFRWWLQNNAATAPSQAVLAELLLLQQAADDSQARVEWGGWAVRLYRDALYLCERDGFDAWTGSAQWPAGALPPPLPNWHWSREGGEGAVSVLRPPGDLTLSAMQGNLRIQRNGMRQQVKELWRAAGVPPWQRRQWPLLYRDQVLVSVPLVGLADGESDRQCEQWFLHPSL